MSAILKALQNRKPVEVELKSEVVELGLIGDILKLVNSAKKSIKDASLIKSRAVALNKDMKKIESDGSSTQIALDKKLDLISIKAKELGVSEDSIKGFKDSKKLSNDLFKDLASLSKMIKR